MQRYQHPVTPVRTEKINCFCAELSGEEAFYIDVMPESAAEPNECFANVAQHIEKHGGEMVLGWAIWEMPNLYAEAEFHAVWKKGSQYLDITPTPMQQKRILFVPDRRLVYDGLQRNNIRKVYIQDPLLTEFFRLSDERFALLNSGERQRQYGEIELSGSEAKQMWQIESKLTELFPQICQRPPHIPLISPAPAAVEEKPNGATSSRLPKPHDFTFPLTLSDRLQSPCS